MSDRLPRTEYDVNYLQIIIFIIVFISLLIISFFAGYYAGKKSSGQKKDILQTKKKGEIKKIAQKKPEIGRKSNIPNKIKQDIRQKIEKKQENQNLTPIKKKVEKQQIKKVEKKKEISKRDYRKGYYIQVAAFKDLSSAKKKVRRYRRRFKVIIYYPKPEDKIKWYRLWIGPYSNKTSLNKTLERLRKEFGKKGFIRKID